MKAPQTSQTARNFTISVPSVVAGRHQAEIAFRHAENRGAPLFKAPPVSNALFATGPEDYGLTWRRHCLDRPIF
jgi:hypothetical protein